MTGPTVRIDLAAAADALARSDEGHKPLPGDADLISAFEGYLQQEGDRYWRAQAEAEWLAEQCPHCGPEGATGPDCGDCPEGSEPR